MANGSGSPEHGTTEEISVPGSIKDAQPPDAETCVVVGIGASAGGLEAVGELLDNLPADIGMAFVLIQHLDPKHASALAGLLGSHTRMQVLEVTDGTEVRPNRVYVIPPNAVMTIEQGVLRLAPRAEHGERHLPIDVFLRSLAKDRKSNAIGVILSGAASDGTIGMKAIKTEEGITFAQDESARFDSMPRSAIASGAIDFVLPPQGIAVELAALARHPYRTGGPTTGLEQEGPAFQMILGLLRNGAGMDFTQYKPATLRRRMERRMLLQRAPDPEAYLDLLRSDPAEIQALANDLLITFTEFFRDPPVFGALKQTAFPTIFGDRDPSSPIRVWAPACATGEEVYSIAICLAEHLQESGLNTPVHIFGTDISDACVEGARAGVYSPSIVSAVSPERLERFFVKANSSYQISRSIRAMCIFAVQNVATDPPFSRMDLVSCRNLLIYLAPSLQNRVVSTLFQALQPRGCLLLGSAETPGSLADYFLPLDNEHRIYSRKAAALRPGFDLPAHVAEIPVFKQAPQKGTPELHRTQTAGFASVQKHIDGILLAQYAPSGVVVDENFRILEFRGDVGMYLAPERGEADLDLFRMVSDDLALHVRGALDDVRQKKVGIRLEHIQISSHGGSRVVNLAVTPILTPGVGQHFLILFEEAASGADPRPANLPGMPETSPTEEDPPRRAAQLEMELASTRRYLQSIIEELRSANEEMQSSNEELQSANEELQTAKEELQGSNEELRTLNTEMESRNAELKVLNDDLLNLLASLRTPILMLDSGLRIRRFTQASEKLLNLIASDVGRPISDLKPLISFPQLEEVLRNVAETLAAYEAEVRDKEGRWYSLRIRPYRTSENQILGTVLQLVDIDDVKRSLELVERARNYASAIVETVRGPLVVLDTQLHVESANKAFFQTFLTAPEETLRRSIYEVGAGQFDFPRLHELLDQTAGSDAAVADVEIERDFERVGLRTMLLNARRIEMGEQTGLILLAFEDITERKRVAEARYRRLFEAAKDGILIVDQDTVEILDANPFLEELLGYRREEWLGSRLLEAEPFRDVPEVQSALERMREHEVVHLPELSLKCKRGRVMSVEVVANTYEEKNRSAIQFNFRDITERKRFDRQLQHTQKLESLGLLAGGIAHDFNNLLTGIMGNASLGLAEPRASVPGREYFREILSASQHAANLTRQMLAYAGKGRFVVEQIDLSQLVREIEPLIHTSIPRMVRVQMDLAADLPLVEADPGQMQQLIMNLFINGAEAIGEDTAGTVLVRTQSREIDGEDIEREFPNSVLRARPVYRNFEGPKTGITIE